MKKNFNELVNECNGKRAKIYYNLNQLVSITGMSIRTLKYRMKEVKIKYSEMPNLLRRERKCWQIHYSIVKEFLPKRVSKKCSINNYKWVTLVGWNMKENYDVAYQKELILQIKKLLPANKIYYVIERDNRGNNHIHLITDAAKVEIESAANEVLKRYLTKREFRLDVNTINNKYSTVQYMAKGYIDSGVIS